MTRRDEVYKTVGADLRKLREEAQLSLEVVGEILGVERDAMSKYERGVRPIPLFDYMTLMRFYRDIASKEHPGVKLAARYLNA